MQFRFLLSGILLILLSAQTSSAQNENKPKFFIEANIGLGKVLPTNEFVRGENSLHEKISFYGSDDIKFGWQTLGTKQWERDLNMPYYGVGLMDAIFDNEEEIGVPSTIYWFFGGSFFDQGKQSLDYEVNLGLSYDWQPYNKITNPFNVAIGSEENVYIDLRIAYARFISRRMKLIFGGRFTHFSNGATQHPNKGMNCLSAFAGLRYHFKPIEYADASTLPDDYPMRDEYNLIFYYGRKASDETKELNKYYFNLFNLSFEYLRAHSLTFRYGPSLDIGVDQHQNIKTHEPYIDRAPFGDQLYAIVGGVAQLRADHIAMQFGMGYKVIGAPHDKFIRRFYQRLGMKVYYYKNLFAAVNIRANSFSIASYIEWGLGVSL